MGPEVMLVNVTSQGKSRTLHPTECCLGQWEVGREAGWPWQVLGHTPWPVRGLGK